VRRTIATAIGICALLALAPARADDPPVDARGAAAAAADALRAGKGDTAEKLATLALQAPDLPPLDRAHVLLNRALAREQQGSRRDALADFNAAIGAGVLAPDEMSQAIFDRGVTLDELGRADEAIADYSAALKIAPAFAPALNNRANAERRLGRLDEAKADYEASLAAGDPQKEYPYYGLGQIAEAKGDTAGAAEDYRQALAANGNYRLAAQRLAALDAQAGGVALHPLSIKSDASPIVTASYQPPAPVLRPAILDRPAPRLEATSREEAAIQLGAYRDEATAADSWNKMVALASGALDGLSPHIEAADIPGKGKFYRLRAGPVGDASAFCAKLQAHKLACIPVKG
jgi:tetratricopeptide (TPR) repeat protein